MLDLAPPNSRLVRSFVYCAAIGLPAGLALSLGASCVSRDTTAGKKEISDIGLGIDGDYVIPLQLRTAYVYNVRNQTFKSRIAQQLTYKIKQEFDRRGRLQVVDDRRRAHVHVYVDLEAYRELPITFDNFNRPTSIDVIAAAVVKVRRQNLRPEEAAAQAKNGAGGKALRPLKDAEDLESSMLIDPTTVQARIHYNIRGQTNLTDSEALYRLTDRLAARIAMTVETGWYTSLKSEMELGAKKPVAGVAGAVDPNSDAAASFTVGTPTAKSLSAQEEAAQQEKKALGEKDKQKLERNDFESPNQQPNRRDGIFQQN